MRICEICGALKEELYHNGYEYGFIANGRKYKPNMNGGFDHEYYRLSETLYCVQEPNITMKEKIGTCVDAVLVMRWLLDCMGVPSKIWLLYDCRKNKVHTVLTFEAEGKAVYLELTPQSSKPWYGHEIVYPDIQAFLQEQENAGYEVTDVSELIMIGKQPAFLLEKLRS